MSRFEPASDRVRSRLNRTRTIMAVLGVVALVHVALSLAKEPRYRPASFDGLLPSVSYNRFPGRPAAGLSVPEDQIRTDLAAIAQHAEAVRTYSSTHGFELVPGIAAELGLNVTLGAWIDKNEDRNEREIASALALARSYPVVVKRLVVGNETVFRHEHTAEDLARILRRVKHDSPVPVATADHWKNFIDHPVLGEAVDEIFAHIIPYWEGFTQKTAVEQSLAIYDRLRLVFPDKKIVIGEFGWPSAGPNFEKAVPSPMAQASVLRDFVVRANALSLDYNIIEAIDQPQKLFEGAVGPYWGILDASLRPKFAWTGPLTRPDRWGGLTVSVLVGLLLSISVLALPEATAAQAALLAGVDHSIGAWSAHVVVYWHGHYLVFGEAFAFAMAVPLIALLMPVVLGRVEELAAVAFAGKPHRLLAPGANPLIDTPKVSIHIPAYREPPQMLLRALDSVAKLNYPDFECVVVINNTPDPAFWQPIEARCQELGERFKFVRVEHLEGFKAGALRVAITRTSPTAQIIGVIDADYVVDPNWLKDLVPVFAEPRVGLVQAPQDHRDGDRSPLHAAMNAEYAGFFDIGMVERNEVDAIIVHGTMCLIRRSALDAAGGWSSDTICEDTDLGLTILELGWRAHYTNRRYGWGLLPQDYQAFKTQRDRWAGGAVQIVKKHWRKFLPGASLLDADQKRAFLVGWLTWFGAETLAVAAALMNLMFVPFVACNVVALPESLLMVPVIAASAMSLLHFVLAYRLRVAVPFRHMLGAVFVFMSMQWTVARAAFMATLPSAGVYFHRTPKGGKGRETSAHFSSRCTLVTPTTIAPATSKLPSIASAREPPLWRI